MYRILAYMVIAMSLSGCIFDDLFKGDKGEGAGEARCLISSARGISALDEAVRCEDSSQWILDVRVFDPQITSLDNFDEKVDFCREDGGECFIVNRQVFGTQETYDAEKAAGNSVEDYDRYEYRVILNNYRGEVYSLGLSDVSFEEAIRNAVNGCNAKNGGSEK